jgi:D-2-hydroxyacid dehydrogenase (NADP+)
VINVSRGGVVDEPALIDALEAGVIAAAGLDVFETEPLPPESPLWEMENVIVTPHVGGRSDRFAGRFADLLLENYDRWRRGEELKNRVV